LTEPGYRTHGLRVDHLVKHVVVAEGAFSGSLLDPNEQLEKLERDERSACAKRKKPMGALH
jgi:hypothetical protein